MSWKVAGRWTIKNLVKTSKRRNFKSIQLISEYYCTQSGTAN